MDDDFEDEEGMPQVASTKPPGGGAVDYDEIVAHRGNCFAGKEFIITPIWSGFFHEAGKNYENRARFTKKGHRLIFY